MKCHLRMREMAYPSTVFRLKPLDLSTIVIMCTQLFKLRLSPSKAEKSNTSAKCLLGIDKSFNCNILLQLVFLGIQDPMFQTFLVFFKIISVIFGIFQGCTGYSIRPDSDKIVLSGIRPDIYYYPAGYRIIVFHEMYQISVN